jgi:Fur family peroxide stress response transcriptional regulator
MNEPIEKIRQQFHARGLKFTPQRLAIYRVLAGTTAHPSVEEIYQAVRKEHPMISLNTVYNTVETLKEIGVITEVSHLHDRARYDANITAHHHIICIQCKKIEDLFDDTIQIPVPQKTASRYKIINQQVEFQGICGDCQSK